MGPRARTDAFCDTDAVAPRSPTRRHGALPVEERGGALPLVLMSGFLLALAVLWWVVYLTGP